MNRPKDEGGRMRDESLYRRFWKAICLFAYRRWAVGMTRKPVGLPLHRDPDNECAAYEPRQRQLSDFRDCWSDGHYLCARCCHFQPEDER